MRPKLHQPENTSGDIFEERPLFEQLGELNHSRGCFADYACQHAINNFFSHCLFDVKKVQRLKTGPHVPEMLDTKLGFPIGQLAATKNHFHYENVTSQQRVTGSTFRCHDMYPSERIQIERGLESPGPYLEWCCEWFASAS